MSTALPSHWKTRRNTGNSAGALGFTGFGGMGSLNALGVVASPWDIRAKDGKDKGRSWDRLRDHQQPGRKLHKTGDINGGDLEWVGGWHDLHL